MLNVVVHSGEKDPFLHVGSEAVLLVPQFRKSLVQESMEASDLLVKLAVHVSKT